MEQLLIHSPNKKNLLLAVYVISEKRAPNLQI